jgi:hypothetical protein
MVSKFIFGISLEVARMARASRSGALTILLTHITKLPRASCWKTTIPSGQRFFFQGRFEVNFVYESQAFADMAFDPSRRKGSFNVS